MVIYLDILSPWHIYANEWILFLFKKRYFDENFLSIKKYFHKMTNKIDQYQERISFFEKSAEAKDQIVKR